MNTSILKNHYGVVILVALFTVMACSTPSGNKSDNVKNKFKEGTYGYDAAFFKAENIDVIELGNQESKARVLLVPGYQGRVMTSTDNGSKGRSFGWINYSFIKAGEIVSHINPYGGEERLWLGPEGGPFSIYFKQGDEQIFSNWQVPKELDTEPFDVVSQSPRSVSFSKNFTLTNALGTPMHIGIKRSVSILSKPQTEQALNLKIADSLSFVAYESENTLLNTGQNDWNIKNGVLSLWMLSMFNPSEKGVVFIPFKKGPEDELGKIVTDDYFGKVPSDRLLIKGGILFFKTDGAYRSKIGISPRRALPLCGSYDPLNKVLTLLSFSMPDKPSAYVNSKWGPQDDPLSGDVVNSYNDGPSGRRVHYGPLL